LLQDVPKVISKCIDYNYLKQKDVKAEFKSEDVAEAVTPADTTDEIVTDPDSDVRSENSRGVRVKPCFG